MNPDSHYAALDRWERRNLEEPTRRCEGCGAWNCICETEEGLCPPALESSPAGSCPLPLEAADDSGQKETTDVD
mgnify:FL=1